GQLDHPGLGRVVAVGLKRSGSDTVDGGDVDDLGEVAPRGRGGPQVGRECLCEEEHRLEVEVHDLVPPVLRELVERRAPGGTGVVDEAVQTRLVLTEPGPHRGNYL